MAPCAASIEMGSDGRCKQAEMFSPLPLLTPCFVSGADEDRALLGLRGFYEPAAVIDPDERVHAGCLHLELAQMQLLHPEGALEAALLFHG